MPPDEHSRQIPHDLFGRRSRASADRRPCGGRGPTRNRAPRANRAAARPISSRRPGRARKIEKTKYASWTRSETGCGNRLPQRGQNFAISGSFLDRFAHGVMIPIVIRVVRSAEARSPLPEDRKCVDREENQQGVDRQAITIADVRVRQHINRRESGQATRQKTGIREMAAKCKHAASRGQYGLHEDERLCQHSVERMVVFQPVALRAEEIKQGLDTKHQETGPDSRG